MPLAAQAPAAQANSVRQNQRGSREGARKTWTPPKTSWGDPDLQGQWPATANIPMQRPANLGTGRVLTDEELAQREKQAQKQSEADSEEVRQRKRQRHHQSAVLLGGARQTEPASLAGGRSSQRKNSSLDSRRARRR